MVAAANLNGRENDGMCEEVRRYLPLTYSAFLSAGALSFDQRATSDCQQFADIETICSGRISAVLT